MNEVEKLFATGGKRYHGVRYPQGGTIRPPLCEVTVLPVDGQPYLLDKKRDIKAISKTFDWGNPLFTDIAQRGIFGHKQLALAILFDTTQNEKIALNSTKNTLPS